MVHIIGSTSIGHTISLDTAMTSRAIASQILGTPLSAREYEFIYPVWVRTQSLDEVTKALALFRTQARESVVTTPVLSWTGAKWVQVCVGASGDTLNALGGVRCKQLFLTALTANQFVQEGYNVSIPTILLPTPEVQPPTSTTPNAPTTPTIEPNPTVIPTDNFVNPVPVVGEKPIPTIEQPAVVQIAPITLFDPFIRSLTRQDYFSTPNWVWIIVVMSVVGIIMMVRK